MRKYNRLQYTIRTANLPAKIEVYDSSSSPGEG